MVSLLDDLRKLKARRQEATEAGRTVADKPDEPEALILLYSAIGEKSEFVRGANSKATDQDKAELARMEKSFSFRWNNLSEDKQKELVDRFLETGLLPGIVKEALDIFDGTVVRLV